LSITCTYFTSNKNIHTTCTNFENNRKSTCIHVYLKGTSIIYCTAGSLHQEDFVKTIQSSYPKLQRYVLSCSYQQFI